VAKRTVSQLDVAGKWVLVRVDFNIPIEQGVEAIAFYDQRLRATLPTIHYLIDQGSRVILCSHLGRPGGKEVDGLRLAPVGDRLTTLLGVPVKCLSETIGASVEESVASLEPGDVALLENLRFHAGEEKNDPDFARSLAGLADCFVMDAFAVTHRAHASTVSVSGLLPSAMGLLVQREVDSLGQALDIKDENKPLAALMGGAKVSDKIMVLENLLGKLDHLIVGGGMSVTFLKAQGYDTGASSIEEDRLDFAKDALSRATQLGVQVHLPVDVVVADRFAADAAGVKTVLVNQVPPDWLIMDIGETTARLFAESLGQCKTIVWNGPMGVFEMPRFSQGTRTVARAMADLNGVTTVVGGGSTAEALEEMGLMDCMTHVSTGGGASLEFLEGKELPGIAALPDA